MDRGATRPRARSPTWAPAYLAQHTPQPAPPVARRRRSRSPRQRALVKRWCGALYHALWSLIEQRALRGARLLALLTALLLPALPLVWLQGVRAEVYAPQCGLAALTWACWASLQRTKDQRYLLLGGLCLGLQASNHTLLALALAVPLSVWLIGQWVIGRWVREGEREGEPSLITGRAVGGALLSGLVGLSLYAYVWLRGRAGGLLGWGWVDDLGSLWETISARVWQRSVVARSAEIDVGENLARFALFCVEQVGPLSALLALALLLLGALRWARSTHRGSITLLMISALCVALTKLTYPFSPINPDFSGYLAAGAPSLCLALGLLCYELSPRLAPALLGALLLGAAAQPRLHGSAEDRSAEVWARALTEELPTQGALWSSHYATHFALSALRATEGWRPDARFIFRGHRHTSWLEARIGPLPSPHSPLARFEVEGPLDPLPLLRRDARATGFLWALAPWSTALSLSQLKARWRSVALRGFGALTPSDAQLNQRRLSPSLGLGLDARYAWALYHEAHLQWLSAPLPPRPQLCEGPQEPLFEAHMKARDAWLSSSHPKELHQED